MPITRAPRPADFRPSRPVRSLYIHVPFCFHKCHYCDFYSIVDSQDRMTEFVDRLAAELHEIAHWAAGAPLQTIFVGGGTPTMLPPTLWRRLLDTLGGAFDLSRMTPQGPGEFTVECNPETADEALFAVLAHGGVNRVSIGAQSFDPRHLKTLERRHEPNNVSRAVALARHAGIQRHSIDLIYAIPGQTLDDCRRDLEHALALGVEHISAYSLTYEPGTQMTARLVRGEFDPVPEDTDAEMMALVASTLRDAGLRRYEVSNFARPGAECRHNLAYWRQRDWLAAGPAASAHVAGHRWKNVPRLGTYLAADGVGRVIEHETPDAHRAVAERIMTGLRLCEGLDAESILASCRALPGGATTAASLRNRIAGLIDQGLVYPRSLRRVERWILTDRGMLSADRIAAELMATVDPQ